MGVVGIETAFATLYTALVRSGKMTLSALVQLMCDNPRKRFGISSDKGFTVFDIGEEYTINPDEFLSMGRATPFKDAKVYGKCLLTVYNGNVVYENLG